MLKDKCFIVVCLKEGNEKIRLVQAEKSVEKEKIQEFFTNKHPDVTIKLIEPLHHKDFHALSLFLPLDHYPLKEKDDELLNIGPVSI